MFYVGFVEIYFGINYIFIWGCLYMVFVILIWCYSSCFEILLCFSAHISPQFEKMWSWAPMFWRSNSCWKTNSWNFWEIHPKIEQEMEVFSHLSNGSWDRTWGCHYYSLLSFCYRYSFLLLFLVLVHIFPVGMNEAPHMSQIEWSKS